MPISHLSVISVPVRDQDRARDFYCDVLGFRLIAEQPMGPDQRWLQLGLPGDQTSITLVTWFETMSPGSLDGIVLTTHDIEATHAELAGKGLVLSAIEDMPWGRFATFDDLDGNGYVLQQPPA